MAMTMQRHGRLMLAVMNQAAPTEEEWGRWLGLAAERIGTDLRAIIDVYGSAGPNARQRQAMTPMLGKIDARTAIMSDSLLVRGLVTAVSWLGIPNAAFAPGHYAAAASYLELTSSELSLAVTQLTSLRRAAGVRDQPRASSPRRRTPSL